MSSVAAAAAAKPGHAAADFEAELVQEAVDLSAVNSAGDGLPDDQKEMESLLHWAIGMLLLLLLSRRPAAATACLGARNRFTGGGDGGGGGRCAGC